ncbi:MAG: purine-binding chemotaxis protein CheW [Symploca sp. SIO1C4]|uniref:Purine-binding chemotaxis protein CheW n=1 Tax=Symploca sp. SIO1C4 TaxID=2607765 RepID=A0A6B3NCX8_9CYAN|nr:purine-binding chemotaxis protein CheW [Symploca sp. SIO1C4]
MSNSLSVPETLVSLNEDNSSSAGEQFLRFQLTPDTTALLPLLQLTEVLTIPNGQIVPIAHMPLCVMGVYNWRGDILWMVDLAQLVGLTPWYQQNLNPSVYRAIVLSTPGQKTTSAHHHNQILGLVINRVEDIEVCNQQLIQSPPSSSINPRLAPFLQGYWSKANGEILVVLNGDAIITAVSK